MSRIKLRLRKPAIIALPACCLTREAARRNVLPNNRSPNPTAEVYKFVHNGTALSFISSLPLRSRHTRSLNSLVLPCTYPIICFDEPRFLSYDNNGNDD